MSRLAVIGCGAIAEGFHLPAVLDVLGDPGAVTLVDPDLDRARALGAGAGITDVASSHADVLDRVDGAIIASPHPTHVPIALDLVDAGVGVLCEKPLGTSVEEVRRLEEAAAARGVVVAVNQTRRFIPAVREIARTLESIDHRGGLEVEVREGDQFDWPAATPAMFGARSGGRGLLLDIGAHVLDLMVHWFGPDLEVTSYRDDSFGGSEASAEVELEGDGLEILIRLSWLAKQRNDYLFRSSAGVLRWGVYDLDAVEWMPSGGGTQTRRVPAPRSYNDLAPEVLKDFLEALNSGGRAAVGPSDVLPSMRLMDACYDQRTRFELPWHDFRMEGGKSG